MSDERVEALERRVEELTRLLETKQDRTEAPAADEPVSRRAALRTAGMLAAGAVAGGVGAIAAASPAAATTAYYSATGSLPGLTASTTNPSFPAISASATSDAAAIQAYSSSAGAALMADGSQTSIQAYGPAGGTGVDVQLNGIGAIGLKVSGLYSDSKAIVATSSDTAVTGSSGNVGGSFGGLRAALHLAVGSGDPGEAFGVTFADGDIQRSTDGSLWYCIEAGLGAPARWRKISGPSTGGAFHPVTPFRAYDSRKSAYTVNGPIANSTQRTIRIADSHNVADGTTLVSYVIPAGATAIAANVTVTATTGNSYFCINPGGTTTLGASTINWFGAGQTIANGVILKVSDTLEVTVVAGNSAGSAQLIIDVTGYWR